MLHCPRANRQHASYFVARAPLNEQVEYLCLAGRKSALRCKLAFSALKMILETIVFRYFAESQIGTASTTAREGWDDAQGCNHGKGGYCLICRSGFKMGKQGIIQHPRDNGRADKNAVMYRRHSAYRNAIFRAHLRNEKNHESVLHNIDGRAQKARRRWSCSNQQRHHSPCHADYRNDNAEHKTETNVAHLLRCQKQHKNQHIDNDTRGGNTPSRSVAYSASKPRTHRNAKRENPCTSAGQKHSARIRRRMVVFPQTPLIYCA